MCICSYWKVINDGPNEIINDLGLTNIPEKESSIAREQSVAKLPKYTLL